VTDQQTQPFDRHAAAATLFPTSRERAAEADEVDTTDITVDRNLLDALYPSSVRGDRADVDDDDDRADEGSAGAYEVRVADGGSPEFASDYANVAREAGVSREAAQMVYDKMLPKLQAQQQAQVAAAAKQWQRESEERFGADLQDVAEDAMTALRRFDDTGELRRLLVETKLMNHPAVAGFLARAGGRR